MLFRKFDETAKSHLDIFLKRKNIIGSDFSYYAFLIWFPDLEYAEQNGVMYMRATLDDGKVYYWPPIKLFDDDRTIEDLMSVLPENSWYAFFTKEQVDTLSDKYIAVSDRSWSEYIYRSQDFIAMSGKRYHAKRNHIAKFASLYNVEMKKYTDDEEKSLEQFEQNWLKKHAFEGTYDESAKQEADIVKMWYDEAKKGNLICDILYANGNIAGVSIGEILPSNNAIILYEKADTEYEGAYTYLAHAFAERNLSSCTYINRQEDMGLEGLRKSKLSYYPEFLLDKYIVKPAIASNSDGVLPKSMTTPKEDKTNKLPYTFRQIKIDEYDRVWQFYIDGIATLSDKKFFLNYTPAELKGVIENGYMLGAFDDEKLVSLCAVDFDKEYGNSLADICNDNSSQYYEFSGIMTDINYRGKGISHFLCVQVIDYAKTNLSPCTLCAVVQYDNTPSLENLSKLGFVESGRKVNGEYDFKYLTLKL